MGINWKTTVQGAGQGAGMGSMFGPWGTAIGGILGGAASMFGKSLGSNVAGQLSSKVGDKIMGIPKPGGAQSGSQMGAEHSNFMDKAYPGTNPWERLGAPGYAGAGVQAAKQTGKNQAMLQRKDLASKERIAQVQAQAHVQSSAMSIGPQAVQSALATQAGRPSQGYDTLQQRQIVTQTAEALIKGSEAQIRAQQARVAKVMADAGVTYEHNKNAFTAFANALKGTQGSATSVAVKVGAGILGGTMIGKFLSGVRMLLPRFAKKVIKPGRLTDRRLKAPPMKKGGLAARATSKIKRPTGKMHKEELIDALGRFRNK